MMMMVAKCNTLSACGTGLLLLFLVLATIASGAEQQLRGSNSINGNGNGNGNGNVNDPRELRQAIGSSSSGGGSSSSSMINANVNSETTVTGTTTTTCGGIRETICSLPDTIFLCRALERTGLDLNLDLDLATTFFAPVDGAMDYLSLSPLVARDLTKPGVLAHVLLEHVLVSSSATNSGNDSGNDNGNGVLESWDDLECGGELVMANGEIVDVVCTENEKEKHLVGVGNRVLRTLPKAVATTNTEDTNVRIETCDGTSVIYLVDQVILPAIPLSDGATTTTTGGGGEDSNNDNNDNDALQAPEQRLCPLSQPTVGSRCPSTTAVVEDLVCAYSYSYQGCSWEYLECAPTKTCTCSEEAADTTTSTTTTTPTFAWSCLSFAARPCFFVNEEEATPVGACDPDLPMPKPPQQQQQVSDNNNGTDVGVDPDEGLDVEDSITDNNSICQATTNPDPNGACDTTDIGTICEYGHVYTGCSWDELQCTWTTRCECYERFSISDSNSVSNSNGFGAWGCVAVKILPCFFFDDEDRDLLPPQGYCDPDLPLPEPPLGSNDNDNTNTTDVVVVVVGDEEDDTDTDSDNCPASRPRPNDACNTAISSCEYGYIYTGCSWDQLKCEWTTRCECQGNGNDNGDTDSGTGTWACLAKGIMPCFSGIGNGRDIVPSFESVFGYESASKEDNDRRSAAIPYPTDLDNTNTNTNTNTNIPDGLPRGERCDPSQPLPEPEETETTTTTVVTVEGRLMEECPSSHPHPQSSCTDDSYVSGLQCEYNHVYAGCSWEEISCVPIVTCTCDQFGSGKWDCMSMAMMRCDSSSTPKGLPFGQYCNPKAPLPTMATTAAATTTATATTMAEQEQRGSVVLAEDASNGGMP